jgi:ATP-binding cassette subfamily F protein uup
MANLINLERVSKSYGIRPLLSEVSLGISMGERVGIVGRNGDGKTTLLEVMTGLEEPDAGRVSRARGLEVAYLHQGDELVDSHTVREAVLAGRSDHEWAADPTTRGVVEELLAGVALDRAVVGLSGGERRRCALAALLLGRHDLLVLDEPTNHLDVEAVAWLAQHLVSLPSALIVVTHDRWFLDAVCQTTWEVHDGDVDSYEGGYAAFVLAKAERQRQAAATEVRRQNLVRKELAWLRRGAPARTSKPKFRIDAATELISDVPPPRDRLELQRFATQRLGKDVLDVEDVDLSRGERQLLDHATWRLGPGERVGIVGVNGAGKTTLLSLLSGALEPDHGRVKQGRTVSLAHLTQGLDDVDDPEGRVLDAVEAIARVKRTAEGRDLSASAMLERFGFTGDKLTTRIGDLSGGERRRFQLLRLLLEDPNVLLLDEPTNDLDIDTLTVVEDFLDSWPGTLVVVSHDRYFLERVTDSVWALLGDGQVSMLPGGVEEYLARRAAMHRAPAGGGGGSQAGRAGGGGSQAGRAGGGGSQGTAPDPHDVPPPSSGTAPPVAAAVPKPKAGSAEERAARKTMSRVEKQLERIAEQEASLNDEVLAHAADHARLADLSARLSELATQKEELELEWLEASELVD